ncbi:MAG: PQQ-binding-like beta-propeller repeat protein, partial [Bacteroidetes bacterium]|nr:PQQ-binding-like beta-propeller repeat protein [Bacteroidota bacterium]
MYRILLLVLLGILHMNSYSQDWPDWRGPNRDAVWEASGIVELFDSDVIDILWSTPIGPGYSGPTVSKGRVYVTDRLERPVQAERVLCFDEQ